MRRKKTKENNFIPNNYQLAIFDAIEHGVGNIVIEAAAGSGKTSTLIRALQLIPKDKKILFCAFNKDIVKELEKKITKQENIEIRTVHSLGYLIILRNLHTKYIPINENKYRSKLINDIKNLSNANFYDFNKTMYFKYIDNICSLVNYARYNLSDTSSEIEKLATMHDIDIIEDEINVVLKLLDWGKHNVGEIDYTDMVWLPYVLYMKPIGVQYDFIFGDEAQDFSVAQRELLFRCQKMGTRYVFCGDKNQCIYSFASASPETFDKLKALPNTTVLPLSISYRCGKKIVEFVQTLVPSIEAFSENCDGEILRNVPLESIDDGDMILCRNNAPLMQAYNELIKNGKKCYIRGKDIGLNLKKIITSTKQEYLNADLTKDGVFARLYYDFFQEKNKIMKASKLDEETIMNMPILANKLDIINTLKELSYDINTKDELVERIKNIFSDKKLTGIALSTIHKAKGLESDNVYIICNSLMPSKSATQLWEKEQEKHLMYVAYTRAKNKLCFVDETIFNLSIKNNKNKLSEIEDKVYSLLNKPKPNTFYNSELAKILLKNINSINHCQSLHPKGWSLSKGD